jgi:hypothetical protein
MSHRGVDIVDCAMSTFSGRGSLDNFCSDGDELPLPTRTRVSKPIRKAPVKTVPAM